MEKEHRNCGDFYLIPNITSQYTSRNFHLISQEHNSMLVELSQTRHGPGE